MRAIPTVYTRIRYENQIDEIFGPGASLPRAVTSLVRVQFFSDMLFEREYRHVLRWQASEAKWVGSFQNICWQIRPAGEPDIEGYVFEPPARQLDLDPVLDSRALPQLFQVGSSLKR